MANSPPTTAEQSGQFEDLNARVGARLQLLLPRPSGGEPVASTLIGYLAHEFLIINAPVVGGLVLRVQNDEPLKARLFTGTLVVEFDTSVQRQFAAPVAYWHLAYPASVRISTLRAAQRVPVDLPAQIECEGQAAPGEGRLVDLNELGARLVAPGVLGQPGSTMQVKFSLPAPKGGEPTEISVTATIKGVRAIEGNETQSHGVQFEAVNERDRLLLQNFVLLRLNEARVRAA